MQEAPKKVNVFELGNKYWPIVRKGLTYWYFPLGVAILVGISMYLKENKIKPVYTGRIVYMIEDEVVEGQGKAGGGNALLMAMTSQGGTNNKAIMVDLSKSNKLIESTLLRTVTVDGKSQLLVNYYIDHSGLRDGWKKNGQTQMLTFNFPDGYKIGSNADNDYLIRSLSETLKLRLESKPLESGLLTMDASNEDQVFVKLFLETHFATISDFYTGKRMERSISMIGLTTKKRDSLLAMLQGKEYGLASFEDGGFGVVKKAVMVPGMQFKRDINILNVQYNEAVLALNTAKLDLERKKPFISIVDDVRLPLDAVTSAPLKKAINWSLISFLGVLVLIIGGIFGAEFLKDQYWAFKNQPAA